MDVQQAAALIGLAVYCGMRLIDALLPSGRHFKFVERWTRPNDDKDDDDDKEPARE